MAALTVWAASLDSRSLLSSPYVTIMVATPSSRRREQLRQWTARELQAQNLFHDHAAIFAITSLSPVDASPVAFFGGEHWHPPYIGSPDSLIDLPGT